MRSDVVGQQAGQIGMTNVVRNAAPMLSDEVEEQAGQMGEKRKEWFDKLTNRNL
jgi:hypothetical protein